MKNKNKRNAYIGIGIGIVVAIVIVSIIKVNSDKIKGRYIIESENIYTPVKVGENIYFPSGYSIANAKNAITKGNIGLKNGGWFSDSFIPTGVISIEDNNSEFTHFQDLSLNGIGYSKESYIEDIEFTKDILKSNNEFVIHLNNEENKEILIDKETINSLENKFGSVKYNIEDFNKFKNIYFIFSKGKDSKIYLGTIFDDGNSLYYGNSNNKIEKNLYERLIKILS